MQIHVWSLGANSPKGDGSVRRGKIPRSRNRPRWLPPATLPLSRPRADVLSALVPLDCASGTGTWGWGLGKMRETALRDHPSPAKRAITSLQGSGVARNVASKPRPMAHRSDRRAFGLGCGRSPLWGSGLQEVAQSCFSRSAALPVLRFDRPDRRAGGRGRCAGRSATHTSRPPRWSPDTTPHRLSAVLRDDVKVSRASVREEQREGTPHPSRAGW
jgi:hypothetical protein